MNTLEEKNDAHKKETVLCPLCGERTGHLFRHGRTHVLDERHTDHWTESRCQECGHSTRQHRMNPGMK